ncbi:nuclear transport factor 2 family protein [Salinibacterium sp. M195]|uniref:nuclear transport factor 2 family protein n=1 Tax=Salinibacterium sp. M195 TaxID=2583374 RepID=UPI001C639B86|nr:nuclear transport factor 2 family protein [Salinibacterium sp. M195]QYH36361.1 nuclear transport factor 2 family protein [Salinibacterium sp. M195]
MNALNVVVAQLAAFNDHDLDAFIATYSPDAVVTGVIAEPIVGREALIEFYRPRFENPQLSCEIETVVQFGDRWVTAREYVRNGDAVTETIATFDVVDGLIQRASMLKA